MIATLRISLALGVTVLLLVVLILLRKQRFNLKYSLVWLLSCICMYLFVLFPDLVIEIGDLMGIKTPINVVLLLIIFLMIMMMVSLTVIVTHLQKRVKTLVQHVGIIEKSIRELEADSEQNSAGYSDMIPVHSTLQIKGKSI